MSYPSKIAYGHLSSSNEMLQLVRSDHQLVEAVTPLRSAIGAR